MYTRCPDCNTVFRIERAQLEAADGEVRCGRCSGIFNALEALSEFQPERAAATAVRSDKPPIFDEAVDDADDDELLEFSLPEERWAEVFLDHELDDEDGATDTGRGDDPTDPGEYVRDDQGPRVFAPEDAGSPEPAAAGTDLPADGRGDADGSRLVPATETSATDAPGDTDEPAFGHLALRGSRRGGRLVWTAATLVLLTALAAQIVHLNRTALAGLPWLGDFIERIYDRAGLRIQPMARATDYRIVTAAASSESRNDGLLRIRATVVNAAERALPYPLVRLTLKDRWGESVGDRLIEPDEYATGKVAPGASLAPEEQVGADIRVVDPGADSFGFELDVCLRDAQGGIACASGDATR